MSTELKTVAWISKIGSVNRVKVLENDAPLVLRSEAEADIARLKEALGLIAEWPVTHPKQNMDAFNMKHIALASLTSGEHQ